MKLSYFMIEGLFGETRPATVSFNEDFTVFTGLNGVGKTTFLKMAWLMLSGNFKQLINEAEFSKVELCADGYIATLSHEIMKTKSSGEEIKTWLIKVVKDHQRVSPVEFFDAVKNSSVFFSTFRKIEGGFSLDKDLGLADGEISEVGLEKTEFTSELEDALRNLSERLSRANHHFIASLSSSDVSGFLMKRYTVALGKSNRLRDSELELLKSQIESMDALIAPDITSDQKNSIDYNLSIIKKEIEEVKAKRSEVDKPLERFRMAAKFFFKDYDLVFKDGLLFFSPDKDIKSNQLSAGQKQILSFISYNAFFENAIFFIDEPELSLHVDWQSQLFEVLLEQNPTNQFIVTTHSPFIYGLYPDKEYNFDENRGCSLSIDLSGS